MEQSVEFFFEGTVFLNQGGKRCNICVMYAWRLFVLSCIMELKLLS